MADTFLNVRTTVVTAVVLVLRLPARSMRRRVPPPFPSRTLPC